MSARSQPGRRGIGRLLRVPAALAGFALLAAMASFQWLPINAPNSPLGLRVVAETWVNLREQLVTELSALLSLPRQRSSAPALTDSPARAARQLATPSTANHSAQVAYGDQLKILFFETLEIPLARGGPDSGHPVATIFPRTDISGEYAVNEWGAISIPRLGTLAAASRTVEELQADLATDFYRAFGRSIDVHVEILDRLPVYVIGSVRVPGAVKFAPGMIVLQAVANAGGSNTGAADTSKAIETIQEREQLQQTEHQVTSLLIKRAMLIAQQNGSEQISMLVGLQPQAIKRAQPGKPGTVANEVAGAQLDLTLARRAFVLQSNLSQRDVDIAQEELDAQKMRLEQLAALLDKKQILLHELQAMATRGSVSRYKILEMEADLSTLLVQQQDDRVTAAQSERRLEAARAAQEKLQIDHAADLQRAIQTNQDDVDSHIRTIASIRAVLGVLQAGVAADASDTTAPTRFWITRRSADGINRFPALETTPLLPGDVVQDGSAGDGDTTATTGLEPARYQGG